MKELPDWLPALMEFGDFGGDWTRYVNEVFAIFHRDFIQTQPVIAGRRVMIRRDPMCEGKEWGFWHCVSEGREEEERTPDLRRCERIGWIRAVIEHCDSPEIDRWVARKNGDDRLHLWFKEEYLVVLGVRKGYYQLITAYLTDWKHTIRKKRAERDMAQKSWHRPT